MSLKVTLSVPNISCHHCTMSIVRETRELPGVLKVEGDVDAKSVTFELEDAASLGAVKQTLVEIGYPAAA